MSWIWPSPLSFLENIRGKLFEKKDLFRTNWWRRLPTCCSQIYSALLATSSFSGGNREYREISFLFCYTVVVVRLILGMCAWNISSALEKLLLVEMGSDRCELSLSSNIIVIHDATVTLGLLCHFSVFVDVVCLGHAHDLRGYFCASSRGAMLVNVLAPA